MGTFRININQETGTDINIINNGIAGENLISGDLCYLNVDGKYWKSNASAISKSVYDALLLRKAKDEDYIPTVEEVQDIVEEELMSSTFHDVAKAYILYRNEQARNRKTNIFKQFDSYR